MNSSKYRFTLDMHSAQSQVSLPVVLNDTARKLYISLADGGKIYHIADGCLAVIRIDRPTGTFLEQFCPIEDNTNIVYDFAQHGNTAIVVGLHECEVTLYGLGNEILSTARFSMVVSDRVVNRDNIIVTDENWTMLDSIAAEEARRQDRFNQALEDVDEAIDSIDETINRIMPPYVGENGNWFVDGKDTGTQAQGVSGVFVGSGQMPEGYNVQIDPEGSPETFVISVNGFFADENGNVEIGGIDTDELNAAVEVALTEAKESGAFKGEKGDKGDKGDTGERGPQGATGASGATGATGPQGVKGDKGDKGDKGADGTSITITKISESSLDGGTNIVTFSDGSKLNIKNGSAGSAGEGGGGGGGIDASQLSAAVEEALRVAKESGDFDGAAGKDGTSATHSWNGTVLTITSASGSSSADLKGEKGDKGDTGAQGPKGETGAAGATGATGPAGADGKTPVKGTDYYTAADKTEMVDLVLAALPVWNGGSY